MLGNALLIALLAAAPDVAALRRELDTVATRIEELKARREAGEAVGDELERLLVRSQELAQEIEDARPQPPAASRAVADPSREMVDELRQYARELREDADRLTGELAELDARIAEARARASAAEPVGAADPGSPRAQPVNQANVRALELPALIELRKGLAAGIRALRVQASNLDAAADAMERSGE